MYCINSNFFLFQSRLGRKGSSYFLLRLLTGVHNLHEQAWAILLTSQNASENRRFWIGGRNGTRRMRSLRVSFLGFSDEAFLTFSFFKGKSARRRITFLRKYYAKKVIPVLAKLGLSGVSCKFILKFLFLHNNDVFFKVRLANRNLRSKRCRWTRLIR